MILALFLAFAAQTAIDDQRFEAVKRTKLDWGTCMEVYGIAAAMTQPDIAASDAAGAALGHCAPQEQAFRNAAEDYIRNNRPIVDELVSSERTKMREVTMAAVVDYRMKHSRKPK